MVSVGLTGLDDEDGDLGGGDVLVLPGHAAARPGTIAALVEEHRETGAAATLLSARLADPRAATRVVRGRDGGVSAIVEDVDAADEGSAIDEVNTSIYCFPPRRLAPALRRLSLGPGQRPGQSTT